MINSFADLIFLEFGSTVMQRGSKPFRFLHQQVLQFINIQVMY